MSSSFITRIEREKDEPYTVIFTTDDFDKYRHIEDECRKMIGHAKPTVDAVPVVRCKDCKWRPRNIGLDCYVEHLDFPCDANNEEVCPYAAGDPWYNKEPHPYGFCHLGVREEEQHDS